MTWHWDESKQLEIKALYKLHKYYCDVLIQGRKSLFINKLSGFVIKAFKLQNNCILLSGLL